VKVDIDGALKIYYFSCDWGPVFKRFNIFLLVIFVCSPLWAGHCLPNSDVTSVLSDIRMEESAANEEFKERWSPLKKWDHCNTKTLVYKVVQGLIVLKNLPPLVSHLDGFDHDILKASPFQFFKERVRVLRLNTNQKSHHCDANVSGTLAYVQDGFSNEMYVCPFSAKFSTLQMLGTLIHEARHLLQQEKFGDEKEIYKQTHGASAQVYAHAPCDIGFFINTPSCDVSPESVGSYGVEMEFYLKLAHTESLQSTLREQSRGQLLDGYLGHFNHIEGGSIGLLLLSEEGSLIFYSPDTHVYFEIMRNVPQNSVLTDRFTPTFYDSFSGTVKSYAGPSLLVDTNGQFAESFRQLPLERQGRLRDVVYGTGIQCLLFDDSVACSKGDEDGIIPLPTALKVKQMSSLRGMGLDLFFVVDGTGRHYLLPTSSPISEWSTVPLKETPSLAHFRSVGIMPGLRRFGISMEGTLVSYDNPEDQHPVKELQHLRFTKLITPFLWSKSLQEL
jgi:hypothetical protein